MVLNGADYHPLWAGMLSVFISEWIVSKFPDRTSGFRCVAGMAAGAGPSTSPPTQRLARGRQPEPQRAMGLLFLQLLGLAGIENWAQAGRAGLPDNRLPVSPPDAGKGKRDLHDLSVQQGLVTSQCRRAIPAQ